jgi:hypothetical protein
MNQRINELALQAEQYARDDLIERRAVGSPLYAEGEYDNKVKQKFAQLIIQECAELTLAHRNDDYYNGWLDYRDEIRRHFGVES